mmetsp:Transcript_32934/g.24255  ORF Transcript_32934/g.24255 Transcript_32934/m.24255 type:complete len:99 (+) Transcript_32934:121-417(+)
MADSKRIYCPNPSCNKVTACNKQNPQKTTCIHCNFEFCSGCQISWEIHQTKKNCKEALGEEMGPDWFQHSDFANCTNCGVRIQKQDGCNHIKCPQCHH